MTSSNQKRNPYRHLNGTNGFYTKTPSELTRLGSQISDSEYRLFHALSDWEEPHPTYEQISKITGLSSNQTISKAIKGLEDKGLISVKRGHSFTKGKGFANQYTLHMPSDWKVKPIVGRDLSPTMTREEEIENSSRQTSTLVGTKDAGNGSSEYTTHTVSDQSDRYSPTEREDYKPFTSASVSQQSQPSHSPTDQQPAKRSSFRKPASSSFGTSNGGAS